MARQDERTAVLESELRQVRRELELLWQRHKARGEMLAHHEASLERLHEWQARASGIAARVTRWGMLGGLTVGAELASGVWGQLLRVLSKLLSP